MDMTEKKGNSLDEVDVPTPVVQAQLFPQELISRMLPKVLWAFGIHCKPQEKEE